MQIRHWSMTNGSGMHHVAQSCAEAERRLGHDSLVIDSSAPHTWDESGAVSADVHVCHTHFPEQHRERVTRQTGRAPVVVFCSHGIPEHNIELTVTEFTGPEHYNTVDYWMLHRHWLRTADAFVVFSPRQQAVFQTMVHKDTRIDLVPLGVDLAFWKAGVRSATDQMRGSPAVWMSENQHRIKWALDIFLAWPFVLRAMPMAHLHAHFIPFDLHRVLVDLANTNGAAYGATISPKTFPHEVLRNIWQSCDFNLATTRYGDNTLLTMQAEAAGLKTISYPGNPHASFWMPEGDQRVMADTLVSIFSGQIHPRQTTPVPDLLDMGNAMVSIYERVVARPAQTLHLVTERVA